MLNRRTLLGAGAAAVAVAAVPLTAAQASSGTKWTRLQAELDGTLVLPADASYATAKELELLQYDDIDPAGIAYCANASDVAQCLAFAQNYGLPLAVRSGGHSLGGYSTSTGLVIDVSSLNAISQGSGTVTIGPGAENVDVLTALAPSGLALVGGACPTVAAGGFIQGGGVGFLTRPFGVTCDSLISAQVVLANGEPVTASARQNSDLYWAIRGGGGGNFGVVTSYTLSPSAVTTVINANLIFSYDQALTMLEGYSQWLSQAPATIGGAAVLTLADAGSGTATAMVILVSVGTQAEFDTQLAELLALTGTPVSQSSASLPYEALMLGLYGCSAITEAQCHLAGSNPQGQLSRAAFGIERSRLFSAPMSSSGWSQTLAAFEAAPTTGGQTLQLQIVPFGGAANDLGRTSTAFVHRDSLYTAIFSASSSGSTATSAEIAAGRQWADGGFAAIDPYSNGETYQNFIDPALSCWQEAYYAENYPRLVAIKSEYDPGNVFDFAQSIA